METPAATADPCVQGAGSTATGPAQFCEHLEAFHFAAHGCALDEEIVPRKKMGMLFVGVLIDNPVHRDGRTVDGAVTHFPDGTVGP